VLLDCWLGNHSSKEISQWVKTHFPVLPVVAFTCDNYIEEAYRKFGFDDYIKKPFDLDLLYQVVARQIQRSARSDSASVSI
jgi:DNA-binding NtrC family response regulator